VRLGYTLLVMGALLAGQAAGASQKQKGPEIAVEPASFDFGRALQNKNLTKDFTIRNLGDAELVIKEVKTTCGCTAAIPGARRVAPGGKTTLHVSLETRSYRGPVERKVLLRSNDKKHGVLAVAVSVTVVPPKKR
jgi:hypothetical protein